MRRFCKVFTAITLIMVLVLSFSSCSKKDNKFIVFKYPDKDEYILESYDFDKIQRDFSVPIKYTDNIPITHIGESAFRGCDKIVNLYIPNGIKIVDMFSFLNCENLKSFFIGKDVEQINELAFGECDSLESITVDPDNKVFYSSNNCVIEKATKTLVFGCKTTVIPKEVTTLKYNSFATINTLVTVSIPEKVTVIRDYAFKNCQGLKSVSLPSQLKTIDEQAFSNCFSMKSIVIPRSVETMGKGVFEGCDNITIYCEAYEKPLGWHEDWIYSLDKSLIANVVWGYKK